MKKKLAVFSVAAFALTGCLSSSDDENETSTPKTLPMNYIVSQMGSFSYASDGALQVTKATCTDRANNYVWEKRHRMDFWLIPKTILFS